MAATKRRRAATSPIEKANQTPDAEFVKAYLEPGAPDLSPWTTTWTHPQTGKAYSLGLGRSACVGDAALEACFELVEATSREDYEGSSQKWRPAEKRKEMREPDLRYIVVREAGDIATDADAAADDGGSVDGDSGINNSEPNGADPNGTGPGPCSPLLRICAFTSLMPTYEEGHPVVYCYEIHLLPELQGTGLGGLLLGFQSMVAHNLGPPVEKVMLTCFLSNARALRFYERQGFATDQAAPATRRLRGGKTFVPDYTILSKPVVR